MGRIYIGTSGYYYKHWVKKFYSEKLIKDKWLEYYSKVFDTVELNTTFYHLPRAKTIEGWIKKTPLYFVFSVKVHQVITHIKKLRNVRSDLYGFMKVIKPLRVYNRLGCLLHQFPPTLEYDTSLLNDYISLLPKGYKHVFEFRNVEYFNDTIFLTLKENNIALCISHMREISAPPVSTANFVYFRFHGPEERYRSSYDDEQIESFAKLIWSFLLEDKEVFVYFNNDFNAYAVENALSLKRKISKLINSKQIEEKNESN
ncbi:MAG: DUF72 domain-containing protein [Candidatus Kryptonium sp.]